MLELIIATVQCVKQQIPMTEYPTMSFKKNLTALKLNNHGDFLEFNNFKYQLERPYTVYADFECNLVKSDQPGIRHTHEPQIQQPTIVVALVIQFKKAARSCQTDVFKKSPARTWISCVEHGSIMPEQGYVV